MRNTLLFTALLLATTTTSQAYTLITNGTTNWKWAGTSVNLYLDTSLADGSAANRQAIYDAVAAWNVGPARMKILARDFSGTIGSWNGRNEIAMIPHKADIGDRPGVTFWNYNGDGTFAEADVYLAADWGFTTSSYRTDLRNYTGTKRSLRGVTIHELGHFLGLGHETDVYNIMGDDSSHAHANGGSVTFYPGEDATHGLVQLYGANGAQDLSVAHWHRCGQFDGYSAHCRNGITDSVGGALPPYVDGNGDLMFVVERGKSYYPAVTLENNGSSAQTANVRMQLSTNDIIGTLDTNLVVVSKYLTPDIPNETTIKITIPSTLAPGDYWLGVFVDPDNAIAEFDEANNRGYVAKLRVQ